MSTQKIQSIIESSIAVKQQYVSDAAFLEKINTAVSLVASAFKDGFKVQFCGNGGSAADAQHLAAEFSGRFYTDRKALPAEALHCNTSYLTAVGNDYGYEKVFSRGIEALGKAGDVLVGFTTSGNSANVLAAFAAAKSLGITTILLAGKDGGKARGTCDHEIIVPSDTTSRIQEIHTLVLHQWLEAIDAVDWKSIL